MSRFDHQIADVPEPTGRFAGREAVDAAVTRFTGRTGHQRPNRDLENRTEEPTRFEREGRDRAADLPTEDEQVEAITMLAEGSEALNLRVTALDERVTSLESQVAALTEALTATAAAGETDTGDDKPNRKKK